MRYHGPGCGGSPHDIEHRHFTWSGGARACDRERLVTVPIPDNQREYDIQQGLVDIVAHTMTITFVAFVNAVLEQLRTDGQWSASYAHWIGTPVPAPSAAEYGS